MKRLAFLAVLVAVLAALLWYSQRQQGPLVVSGFLEADEIRVGSRVGGRVARVLVEEGQRVAAGDSLVELEPFDLLERKAQVQAELAARQAEFDKLSAGFRTEEKAQAQARLDQLAARLEKLQNGPRKQEVAAAQARLRLANAQLELAQMQHQRTTSLVARGAATADQADEAETQLKVAREGVRVREEELNELLEGTRPEDLKEAAALHEEARQALVLAENGYRQEDVARARAERDAAEAAVQAAEDQVRELTITAPVDGFVEAIELQPGDLVSAGAPAVSLLDATRLWVRAYLPENRLSIQLNQPVSITVDSYPGRFAGHVSYVARGAEFTPGNVQTPEERSKQVFRIKVTLDEGLDRLRPGMMADVWLEE